MEFHKEKEVDGFYSLHVTVEDNSELLCMCPDKRRAAVLLRVLREGLSERIKEMENNKTYNNTQTYSEATDTSAEITTKEAINENQSIIKLTTDRNGLRLISSRE